MKLKQLFSLGIVSTACAFAIVHTVFNRGDNVAEMEQPVDDNTHIDVFVNFQTSQDSLDAQNRALIEIKK